jgi:hypothetical protein
VKRPFTSASGFSPDRRSALPVRPVR